MKKLTVILTVFIFLALGYYVIDEYELMEQEDIKEKLNVPKLKTDQTKKDKKSVLQGDLFDIIGKKTSVLENEFGSPLRKDLTPYGYKSWVYTDEESNFILFGVKDDVVETIFATGEDVASSPFKIGDSYEELDENFSFESEVSYQDGLSFYTFKLNDEDIKTNPLIKLSDNLFIVSYFDTFTNELSSVRMMTGDMLTRQRFFEMEYRGSLPEEESLSKDDWSEIEDSMEKQIYEMTNIYRNRFDLDPLNKDKDVAKVAYTHSEDMYENNFFSHDSQDGRNLKDRLEQEEIYYLSAGENIAAQHTDAPAAMEGWLNSEGHRDAMLYEDYNYIGVGVHHLYYTQNFLLKP